MELVDRSPSRVIRIVFFVLEFDTRGALRSDLLMKQGAAAIDRTLGGRRPGEGNVVDARSRFVAAGTRWKPSPVLGSSSRTQPWGEYGVLPRNVVRARIAVMTQPRAAALVLMAALVTLVMSAWVAAEVHAQEAPGPRRIAVVAMALGAQSKEAKAFRQALRDAGYVDGRDISIDWWSGGGDYAHVSEAVADAVQRKVDVIVVAGTPVALAAKRSTSTIPIVMALVADPLGSGLVASLARPGGNVTGLSSMAVELSSKRLATPQGDNTDRRSRWAHFQSRRTLQRQRNRTSQNDGAGARGRTDLRSPAYAGSTSSCRRSRP